MNTTLLYSIVVTGLLQSLNKIQVLQGAAGKLTTAAFNSQYHSINQVYAIDIPDGGFDQWNGYVPLISLREPYTVRWKIENALIMVRMAKHSMLNMLSNILSQVGNIEKIILVILLDHNQNFIPDERFIKQLAGMLLQRGMLNYCILHPSSTGNQLLFFKYDTVANHFLQPDLNSPFKHLFPPFIRTLAGHKLNALLSDNYPYAYILSSVWEGVDAYILTLAKQRFRCDIQLVNTDINGKNALYRMDLIRQRLAEGSIDIHMPRAHVSTTYVTTEVVSTYEWESLVLVVPKSDQLNLTNIMLQPFSIEVWTLVLCYWMIKQLFKLISFFKRHCKRFRLKKPLRCRWSFGSLGSVATVGVELVSFLLIEAYLAKITEFLLYCRFRPDPQTLEEFFESNIPVLIPKYMDPLVNSLGPAIADNLKAKTIRPEEYAKMAPSCCARIHTLPRAEYIVRMAKHFDATLGRKQLYILPEHLKIIPMSYLLGKNFAFKNSFEMFLLNVYESGLVGQYVDSHRKDMALMERNFFTKGWLTLGDLLPLFLLVVAGWCCSLVAFLSEVFGVYFKRYWNRNRVQPFEVE